MRRLTDYYVDPLEEHEAQRRDEIRREAVARAERRRLLAYGCLGLAFGIYVGTILFAMTGPVDPTDELPPGVPLHPDASAPAPTHSDLPTIEDWEIVVI